MPVASYVLATFGWRPADIGIGTAVIGIAGTLSSPFWGRLDDRTTWAPRAAVLLAAGGGRRRGAERSAGCRTPPPGSHWACSVRPTVRSTPCSPPGCSPRVCTAAGSGAVRSFGSLGWVVGLALAATALTVWPEHAEWVLVAAALAMVTAPFSWGRREPARSGRAADRHLPRAGAASAAPGAGGPRRPRRDVPDLVDDVHPRPVHRRLGTPGAVRRSVPGPGPDRPLGAPGAAGLPARRPAGSRPSPLAGGRPRRSPAGRGHRGPGAVSLERQHAGRPAADRDRLLAAVRRPVPAARRGGAGRSPGIGTDPRLGTDRRGGRADRRRRRRPGGRLRWATAACSAAWSSSRRWAARWAGWPSSAPADRATPARRSTRLLDGSSPTAVRYRPISKEGFLLAASVRPPPLVPLARPHPWSSPVKVTVVGGASTYTPELVDGFARLRDVLPVDTLVLADPAADRLDVVGGMARRMLAKAGPPRDRRDDDRHRRRASPTPTPSCSSCASAGRPPACRTRPGRSSAAASARRRPAPAAWPRRCAPCRSCCDIAETVRERAADRRLDRRLHQPGRHRHAGAAERRATARSACATWRSASSAGSPSCSASRPDEVTLGHVGLNHLTWERVGHASDGRDVLPELLDEARGRDSPSEVELPACAAPPARRRPVVLPALLLRPRRGGRASSATAQSRAEPRRGDGGASCSSMYADPAVDDEAGAARPARRRVLLRGRRRPARLADRRPRRRAGGQPAQRRHAALPARRRRHRGARDDHAPPGRPRVPVDAVPPIYSGPDRAPCRATSSSPWTPRSTAAATACFEALLAHPLVGQSTRPRSSPTCSSPPTGSTSAGRSDRRRGRTRARPRHRRRATARPTSSW